jgi:hypothetical protein
LFKRNDIALYSNPHEDGKQVEVRILKQSRLYENMYEVQAVGFGWYTTALLSELTEAEDKREKRFRRPRKL